MTQFAADMVGLLADVTLLNRTVYGGPDALQSQYLHDYDAGRDPDTTSNREALFVYDRYDQYLQQFGQQTLSSAELGFEPATIDANETTEGLDHNFTYAGDLFRNNYQAIGSTEVPFTQAGAVALVSLKDTADGKTLYLTLRGTDADGPTADGEAGTANGQMRYYQQLKGLVDQVYDYVSDPDHDISNIVVSGHSLGGTMADIFALYDGARFAAIDGVKLSVVALASAGVAPELLAAMPGWDESLVNVGDGGAVTFNTPDWYFQYDQANDIVRNTERYEADRHLSEDPTQAPITAGAITLLKDHLHFEDHRLQFETPMIDQYAVSAKLETNFLVNHYADFYELIGTEFSKTWPAVGERSFDRFIALFGESDVLDGTPGSNNVNGWGVSADDSVDYSAETANLFLLGFSGNDRIRTGVGADFLCGGADDDRLRSGSGSDLLFGDSAGHIGNDVLRAGAGADKLRGGRGDDRLTGGLGADVFVFATGSGSDVIRDFDQDGRVHDLVDLSRVKGIGNWHDLRTNHLEADGASTVIAGDHGETILIRNTDIADLDRALFIL